MAKTYIIVESEHQFAVYVEGEDIPMAFLAHERDFVQLSAEGMMTNSPTTMMMIDRATLV